MITPEPTHLPHFAALSELPPRYVRIRRLDLESRHRLIWLNIGGFLLMVGGGFVLLRHALYLPAGTVDPFAGFSNLPLVGIFLVGFALMLVVHELLHGVGFRLFGARVRYGFAPRKGVAFAAADDHYLTRNAYLIVALLPLVGITLLTLTLLPLTAGVTRVLVALIGAFNIGGAVGDLWFTWVCLRSPRTLLVRDFGEGADLYLQDSTTL